MGNEPTTFGLDPDKLARIMKICSESAQVEDKMTSNQQKEELLQDHLSETLLTGSLKNSLLRKELTQICRVSGLLAGEPIRDLLTSSKTQIDLIEKIKEHGKKLSKSASSEAEHDTANAIYYAAIAYALVFHNRKITKFSYKDLGQAFEIFSRPKWVSSDLAGLFERARQYCQDKVKEMRGNKD